MTEQPLARTDRQARGRRVLSVVRDARVGALRRDEPALDTNAYAVVDEIDLTLVLKDDGVELALAGVCCEGTQLAHGVLPVTEPARDLRALLSCGVRIHVVEEDLACRGLTTDDLIEGVTSIPETELAGLMLTHEVTLSTGS